MSNKKTLREFLTEFNNSEGWSICEEGLYESLVECFKDVHSEKVDSRRWYDIYEKVIKVDIDGEERFFKTPSYHTTGDLSPSDMDLTPITLEDVWEVFPKEVVTTVYE